MGRSNTPVVNGAQLPTGAAWREGHPLLLGRLGAKRNLRALWRAKLRVRPVGQRPYELVRPPCWDARERLAVPGGELIMADPKHLASVPAGRGAVESCWLCGIHLPTGQLVADGGGACSDLRWYCRDMWECTQRWTARPARGHRRAATTLIENGRSPG
jgi:hypothetical protein